MTRTFRTAALWMAVLALLAVAERALERQAGAQQPPLRFEVDPLWPKKPPQWTLGQVSGIAVDGRDHVWLIQRPWSLNDDEKATNPEAVC